MTSQFSRAVIDIFPWPNGLGFQDAATWWAYVHSQSEPDRLNLLLVTALLNEETSRLLLTHDPTLWTAFRLSAESIARLAAVEATTLSEFVSVLLHHPD